MPIFGIVGPITHQVKLIKPYARYCLHGLAKKAFNA